MQQKTVDIYKSIIAEHSTNGDHKIQWDKAEGGKMKKRDFYDTKRDGIHGRKREVVISHPRTDVSSIYLLYHEIGSNKTVAIHQGIRTRHHTTEPVPSDEI
jgi:hypothetical protein